MFEEADQQEDATGEGSYILSKLVRNTNWITYSRDMKRLLDRSVELGYPLGMLEYHNVFKSEDLKKKAVESNSNSVQACSYIRYRENSGSVTKRRGYLEMAVKYQNEALKCGENTMFLQKRIGDFYRDMCQDDDAFLWYAKAADQGVPSAYYNLAFYYFNGLGGVDKNTLSAWRWCVKGARINDYMCRDWLNESVTFVGFEEDEKTRHIIWTFIALRKFKHALTNLPMDLVILIAKTLWKTRKT